MKRTLFIILPFVMLIAFISCERPNSGEKSPVKGKWESRQSGATMTLDFGDKSVEYTFYMDLFESTVIYYGTYEITDSIIDINFSDLSTKNSSGISYTNPADMPTKAILHYDNTIEYIDYIFYRHK